MHPKTRWFNNAMLAHEGRLLRYARSLTGDLDSAQDAVQETFLRLMKQSPERVEGHLTPWLFRVCRNLIIDTQRKEQRMMHVALDANTPEPSPSPHQALEANDRNLRVTRGINALPDPQREVIRLKFQEGLSYKQIAEITGHSTSNVGVLIHTAVRTLRTSLHEEDQS